MLALPPPVLQPGDRVIWRSPRHHYYQRGRYRHGVGRVMAVKYWIGAKPTVQLDFGCGRTDVGWVHEVVKVTGTLSLRAPTSSGP